MKRHHKLKQWAIIVWHQGIQMLCIHPLKPDTAGAWILQVVYQSASGTNSLEQRVAAPLDDEEFLAWAEQAPNLLMQYLHSSGDEALHPVCHDIRGFN